MFNFMQNVIPYISGLYTLPWIVIGFIFTIILVHFFSQERIDRMMKRIGLIILYFFIPPLVFRIFLDTPIGTKELVFVIVVVLSILFMYLLAYFYARYQIKKQQLSGEKRTIFLKTIITNQGRSSAFVGGAMLAIPGWGVQAAIFMALVGITLFAVIPYILYHINNKERKAKEEGVKLPWFLNIYPWYFICFVVAAILLQKSTGITSRDLGDLGILIRFYTALTIPIALYYVGAVIHPNDLKTTELKKLVGMIKTDSSEHWSWVRQIIVLTTVITPLIIAIILGILLHFNIIPASWFSVIVINAALPITSTNIFIVPYGLDQKTTAHAITWSTLLCVPLVVILIGLFSIYFP
ncbi:MAG: hypothetical protein K0B81_01200 [Candidatus Cloacimonetes bacterium]|nr:hypothetical protein [Candidatus Cloacimonadota bacterium]